MVDPGKIFFMLIWFTSDVNWSLTRYGIQQIRLTTKVQVFHTHTTSGHINGVFLGLSLGFVTLCASRECFPNLWIHIGSITVASPSNVRTSTKWTRKIPLICALAFQICPLFKCIWSWFSHSFMSVSRSWKFYAPKIGMGKHFFAETTDVVEIQTKLSS